MKILEKNRPEIGQFIRLITIKNEMTGESMFMPKEVCKAIGENNSAYVMKEAKLTPKDTLIISKDQNSEIFERLVSLGVNVGKKKKIKLLTNSGYQKLIRHINFWRTEELNHWMDTTGVELAENFIKSHDTKELGCGLDYDQPGSKFCIGMIGNDLNDQMRTNDLCTKLGFRPCENRLTGEGVLMLLRPEIAYAINFINEELKNGEDYNVMIGVTKNIVFPLFRHRFGKSKILNDFNLGTHIN